MNVEENARRLHERTGGGWGEFVYNLSLFQRTNTIADDPDDPYPVELKVATIFCAMMALFPIPLITNLPLLFKMAVTAFSKEESIYLFNSTKASDSIANAFFAMVIMFSFIFDFSY